MAARVLNALLQREDWARERLARHAGKTVRLVVGGLRLDLGITSDGRSEQANAAIVPDVILTLPADRLAQVPAMLRSEDPSALAELMHIEGDAGLARVVSDLARDLRWDVENDLAAVVGDVAARRLVTGMRSLAVGAQQSVERLRDNVGEYLQEESGLLVGRAAYDNWSADLATALDRLSALEARVGAMRSGAAAARIGG